MAIFSKNNTIKKGEIILLQGEASSFFYTLESGAVEILAADTKYNGLDRSIILEHSTRVGIINEKTCIPPLPGKTLRALSDVQLQKYQVSEQGFMKIAAQEPAKALLFLAHLFRRMEASFADIPKYIKLYQNLSRLTDNLVLLTKELSARELPSHLKKYAEELSYTFQENGGKVPGAIEARFLVEDNGRYLRKNYALPGTPVDALVNKEQYAFFKRFLKIDKNVFGHLIKSDPGIPNHMFTKVLGFYSAILDRIASINTIVIEQMDAVFGKNNSWLIYITEEQALDDFINSGRLSPNFIKQTYSIIMRIYAYFSELTGKDAEQVYPGAMRFKEFIISQQKAVTPGMGEKSMKPVGDASYSSSVAQIYANSLQQIFEFALVEKDLKRDFLKYLSEFKKMDDPFTSDPEGRKIRRHLGTLYWRLYSQVYIRSKSERKVPAPVKLMLLFGFVDETLVDPEQISVLHKMSQEQASSSLPVVYEHEFLSRIYSEDEEPSITEMGLTYDKYMGELNKYPSKKKKIELGDSDETTTKILYEITNRVTSTTAACSGSRLMAFPIFNSHLVKGDPRKFIVTKKKLEETVRDLINTDYSVFFRETILKLDPNREIIEEEIIPYFILLPTFGSKTMTWQELVGINKRSRGRIVVPIFFTGDLRKSLAHSFAVFRWELSRTMRGGMWADPVEGGLTGSYYDYVQFYKKNSKLSTEAKERVAERLKSFRNNTRELFADDYILWVTYEREGILKLNSYVRDMFYRLIPFPQSLRAKLENMPAFNESVIRFRNIRTKTIGGFERRYKKYMDENGNLPPELQKFLDYLKM